MRWILGFPMVLALAFPTRAVRADGEAAAPSANELLARMRGADHRAAGAAADALVRMTSDDFVPAALEQLKEETRFHARIALGYVLATHGEKAGLEVLVDSLEETGHLGYVYLTRVAGVDHGWNRDGSSLTLWRKWLAGFTSDEYRERVRRERLSPQARRAGARPFETAVKALCDGADRAAVATQLRGLAKEFPQADAAADALEIAQRLDEEAKEDAAWREPPSPATLSGEARTAWLVYRLRDTKGVHLPFDGYTSVLPTRSKGSPSPGGAVAELLAGGAKSIPILLGLLEDRRPIRAAGSAMKRVSNREWSSVRVVLRYQDAALEMLNVLLPTVTYERKYTATYLSAEDPDDRRETIASVRSWAAETAGKSALELQWAGIRRAGVREALEAIRRLAAEPRQTKEALAELKSMFSGRHWIHQPAICEVMADLGDTSNVAEVIEALDAGKYSGHMMQVEGDTAASLNAEMTARRIKEKFGKARSGPREADGK